MVRDHRKLQHPGPVPARRLAHLGRDHLSVLVPGGGPRESLSRSAHGAQDRVCRLRFRAGDVGVARHAADRGCVAAPLSFAPNCSMSRCSTGCAGSRGGSRRWCPRSSASLLDTAIFFTLAFAGTDVPWVTLAFGDFGVKLAIALFALVPFRVALALVRPAPEPGPGPWHRGKPIRPGHGLCRCLPGWSWRRRLALPGTFMSGLAAIALVGAVIAAVHHAEVVAHRVGEPFGTLVLAVAVTVIEVALIVSVMLSGGPRQGSAAARHGVRRHHDLLQRHRRALPADGRHAPSRAGIPGAGRERRVGRSLRLVSSVDGPA